MYALHFTNRPAFKWGFRNSSAGHKSTCNAGDTAGPIPGSGRCPGGGKGSPSGIPAWRISWTGSLAGCSSGGHRETPLRRPTRTHTISNLTHTQRKIFKWRILGTTWRLIGFRSLIILFRHKLCSCPPFVPSPCRWSHCGLFSRMRSARTPKSGHQAASLHF